MNIDKDKRDKIIKAMKNGVKNRLHYNSSYNTLVEADTIFFDINHCSSFRSAVSRIFTETISGSIYHFYFKEYILEDLYFLGYINHKDYLKLKFSIEITESSLFQKYIKDFTIEHGTKDEKVFAGNIWTNSLEIKLVTLVVTKYFRLQEEIEKRNKIAKDNKELKNKGKRPIVESDKSSTETISNNIPWNSYFMGIAKLASMRSKDPVCKVGACIVKNKKVLSTGYNGFPTGLDDKKYPWTKGSENPVENKFFYVIHAELNAILNSDNPVIDSTLYVTKFPCNECAKAIIQSGIKKIIYSDDKEDTELFAIEKNKVTFNMLFDAGVKMIRYIPIGHDELIHL